MNPHFNNAAAAFSVQRQISPVVLAPSTVTGTGIDKLAFGNPQSCKLEVISGVRTGACNADAKLQDSADNSAWADYIPPRGPTGVTPGVAADGAITQIVATDTTATKNIDLSSSRRYVRASVTAAGGTTIAIAANIILCGGDTLPQP